MTENRDQWNILAEKYSREVLAQTFILFPGIKKYFLNSLKYGDRVLDLGCGDGKYTQLISEVVGMQNVKGVDVSGEQIKLAKNGNTGIDFSIGGIEDEIQNYNYVFANMVLCNISFSKLESFIANVSKNLDTEGIFIFTNVASSHQKTFNDDFMEHIYPEEVKSGDSIKVSLRLGSGEIIGPFINFHYDLDFIKDIAERHGFKFIEENLLEADTASGNTPCYTIVRFRKI